MPDMLVKLRDLPDAEALSRHLRRQGVLVRPARANEKHIVVEWVRRTFGERWASECDVAFANRPVSCWIAAENGQIVGFSCYESTCRDFFGPMGVKEALRGRGIGKALCLSCLQAMAQMGYAYAIIGSVGPADFYATVAGATLIEEASPGIHEAPLTG